MKSTQISYVWIKVQVFWCFSITLTILVFLASKPGHLPHFSPKNKPHQDGLRRRRRARRAQAPGARQARGLAGLHGVHGDFHGGRHGVGGGQHGHGVQHGVGRTRLGRVGGWVGAVGGGGWDDGQSFSGVFWEVTMLGWLRLRLNNCFRSFYCLSMFGCDIFWDEGNER